MIVQPTASLTSSTGAATGAATAPMTKSATAMNEKFMMDVGWRDTVCRNEIVVEVFLE